MNIPLLAADIVRRVKGSTDSVLNLETVVANLIRSEQERDLEESRNEARQAYRMYCRDGENAKKILRDFHNDFGPK